VLLGGLLSTMWLLLRLLPLLLPLVSSASHPNILLLIADDMRPNLGCYASTNSLHFSSPTMSTPALDKLASSALLLENAFVQQAICSPSRTSFLTGRRPDTTRVTDLHSYWRTMGGNFTTIPQFFKEQGYRTAGLGKVFHDGGEATPGDDPLSWTEPYHRAKDDYNTDYPWPWETTDKSRSWRAVPRSEVEERGPLQDTLEADWAIKTLREFAPEAELGIQPFFLAFGLRRPHLPFYFPEEFLDLYPEDEDPRNPWVGDIPSIAWSNWGEMRAYQDCSADSLGNPDLGSINVTIGVDKTRELRRAYYAAVSYADSEIGRVISEVEELGLADDTIVVFLGDHGWQLGEHAEWCKHTNFEVAARAPLIIRVPGLTDSGVRTGELVEFVDLFPTLVEAAGFPGLERCPEDSHSVELCTEGASLLPLMAGREQGWKEAVFFQYPRQAFHEHIPSCMGYSVRTQEWRYTEWVRIQRLGELEYLPSWEERCNDEDFHLELYSMVEDPEENTNLAREDGMEELVEELSARLRRGWRGEAK